MRPATAAVGRALAAAGWRVAAEPHESSQPRLFWAEFSAVHWDAILAGRSAASAQYLKSGLVRKADLLHYMRKHGGGGWHPQTLVADIEDEDDVAELCESWASAGISSGEGSGGGGGREAGRRHGLQ